MSKTSDLAAVEASLRRRFRVVETTVRVLDRDLSILHPESAEDLIDERDFERDERLPYWAELWPSALILAVHVRALRGGGRRMLELGCGAGLVAVSAALAGFAVVASDYYEDAVRFARVNAARNGTRLDGGRVIDWRNLPSDLPRFDILVASDVLYERPYGRLVAHVIDRLIAPEGTALLADPGRVGRDEFIRALGGLGLTIVSRVERPFAQSSVRQTITLFEIARSAE